jgi:hypothetical protein
VLREIDQNRFGITILQFVAHETEIANIVFPRSLKAHSGPIAVLKS